MAETLFNREVRVVFTDRDNPSDIVTIEDPKIADKEPIRIDFQVEKELAFSQVNRAFIEIYNLSDSTAAKINFRKPVLDLVKFIDQRYGRKVDLFAGYNPDDKPAAEAGTVRKIFSGVVVSAITSREGPLNVTRIECFNVFYELMRQAVKIAVDAKEEKSSVALRVLRRIGANIDAKSKAALIERLRGRNYGDATTLQGTAYDVLNKINRGLLGIATINFDDVATSFNPVGVPNDEQERFYSQGSGLIGTPKPTETGCEFIVQLDNELKLGTPVALDSRTILSFDKLGKYVVKQVIHSGSNDASGDFQSRVTAVFNRSALGADLINGQAVA